MTSDEIKKRIAAALVAEEKMQGAIDQFEATEGTAPPMDHLLTVGVHRVKTAVLECALQLALMNERAAKNRAG